MRRKEVLYAVIGGVVGAVLTMAVGRLSPLGAQNGEDAVFGTITCTGLNVVGSDWRVKASISELGDSCVVRFGDMDGAGVWIMAGGETALVDVVGDNHKTQARMSRDEHGGVVKCNTRGSPRTAAQMCVTGDGNGVVYTWDKQGNRLR